MTYSLMATDNITITHCDCSIHGSNSETVCTNPRLGLYMCRGCFDNLQKQHQDQTPSSKSTVCPHCNGQGFIRE